MYRECRHVLPTGQKCKAPAGCPIQTALHATQADRALQAAGVGNDEPKPTTDH
jgi:hypothetical protein